MDPAYYQDLTRRALAGERLGEDESLRLLVAPEVELLPLVQAAFEVRRTFWGRKVRIHILNNAQNGHCPEDCGYCAQGRRSEVKDLEDYPMKSDAEILEEARRAAAAGAFRYCMVFAGRGPSDQRVERLSQLIREIKTRYAIEVCVSPGLLRAGQAERLKAAGLDRLNHNLNTSEENYPSICTTHGYADRLRTLEYCRGAGLTACSGMILGLGEGPAGAVRVLRTLAELGVQSIPLNFLVSIPGAPLGQPEKLTPEYCLRALCLARLLNPRAEVRAAGGREAHLRGLQALALYPANSLFMEGYLNVPGAKQHDTLRLIREAGFEVECEVPLPGLDEVPGEVGSAQTERLKTRAELRPALQPS